MSVRAALSSMGWKPDTPAKRVIEYSVLDFEFAVKPKMESLMGSGSRSLDFFVADPRGYGSIFVKMADHFKDRILLNKIVKSVSYSRYGVRVTTVDGETFAANYGLCTFSSGVLASDSVSFSPKLPQWKLEAINKIQMAHYTKIFIKFPYKFWDSHEFILYAHHIRGYYPVWMDLKARDIFPGSAILHVTVTGEMGIKVEGQSESETLKEIMTELRKVYGSNIPNAEGTVKTYIRVMSRVYRTSHPITSSSLRYCYPFLSSFPSATSSSFLTSTSFLSPTHLHPRPPRPTRYTHPHHRPRFHSHGHIRDLLLNLLLNLLLPILNLILTSILNLTTSILLLFIQLLFPLPVLNLITIITIIIVITIIIIIIIIILTLILIIRQ